MAGINHLILWLPVARRQFSDSFISFGVTNISISILHSNVGLLPFTALLSFRNIELEKFDHVHTFTINVYLPLHIF